MAPPAIGRVRWLDPFTRCGVLADVRGTEFFFDSLASDRRAQQPPAAGELSPFRDRLASDRRTQRSPSRGELVHFQVGSIEGLGRIARDVRPASARRRRTRGAAG